MNGEEQAEITGAPEEVAPEVAPAAVEEFPFVTLPPQITYQLRDVQPAAWLHITANDQLVVQMLNGQASIAVRVSLRLLLPTGEIKEVAEDYSPPATRVTQNYWIPLPESYLLTATVIGWGGLKVGGCWVRCLLVYGGPKCHTYPALLVAGYVADFSGLAWPYPRYIHPCEGPGRLRLIVGTDPAPGNEITESVSTGARWRVLSIRATLVTDSTAATRAVLLSLWDGATLFYQSCSLVDQPASNTYYYQWAQGIDRSTVQRFGRVQDQLPMGLCLTAGQSFTSNTAALQAGDNWGAPVYLVEEWIEP